MFLLTLINGLELDNGSNCKVTTEHRKSHYASQIQLSASYSMLLW